MSDPNTPETPTISPENPASSPQTPESSPGKPTSPAERLPLEEMYPACFSWKKPKPLKIGIHRDMVAAGYDLRQVRRTLMFYTRAGRYKKIMQPGAARIDLNGEPVGVVTEEEAQFARLPPAPAKKKAPPHPPRETPVPKEKLAPGRLELTVKFSELPKSSRQQNNSLKVEVQINEEQIVTTFLTPKVWKKLDQANFNYPEWVAVLTGQLDYFEDKHILLKQPAMQVFEKKPKQPPA